MSSTRIRAVALIGCSALAVGACGGSTSHTKPAFKRAATFKVQTGLLGGAASAGTVPTVQSYVPTGKIVADSGFRPYANGFAFENYGNNAGPINLTPANVEDLFGPQVCATGTGSTCKLTPSAKQWMTEENAAMADGHCMGFSVTALRFFTGNLSTSQFGGSTTPALQIQGNDPLQSQIAEDWAYQSLPSVRQQAISGTPDQVLTALINGLRAGKETYTLAFLKADGTGGHAITPFAVEDRGGGQMEILVYDNNFPGVIRKFDVNTIADSWHYVGGINPADTSEIYEGDARTKSMFLFPTNPGEGTQPCPFCAARAGTSSIPSTVGPTKGRFLEVALTGRTAEHPHLVFVDLHTGLKTGFVNGQLLQQIPGILVNQNFAVQDWQSAVEPTYDLQFGHPPYEVIVDGADLTKPVVESITVNGDGVLFTIKDIRIAPGQKDYMLLPTDDLGITYTSHSSFAGTPTFETAFVQYGGPAQGGHSVVHAVVIAAGAIGYAPGSPFTLQFQPKLDLAEFGSPGRAVPLAAAAKAGGARSVVYVSSTPLAGGGTARTYFSSNVKFDPSTELAAFNYFVPEGAALPIEIIKPNGQIVGRTFAPAR